MFGTSQMFDVNAEIKGVMLLLSCPRMAQKSGTSKVEALLEPWTYLKNRLQFHSDCVEIVKDIILICMMSLHCFPRTGQESETSKLEALLTWRQASRDDEAHTARTTAFRDVVSQSEIQDTPVLIVSFWRA
ncbi:unnamed protein product [Hymenolepis diminuta]|uniref:Uncharacterized protein n=1 Tax=Hymenolepis diminuta TaxID=6216 RepID=A0A564ZDC0_HYMDI|nr:unnamed protein product [Hymenolepis diminuta]